MIREMYHHRPVAERLYHNTFVSLTDYPDDDSYREELYSEAEKIEAALDTMVSEKELDVVIPQNIWSVGAHPSVAIALDRVAKRRGVHVLAHHHDFYWERVEGVSLTCRTAVELADRFLPPHDPSYAHVVINRLAQEALYQRKGIESQVIPNIFDFDGDPWIKDEYNSDFRESFGIKSNDIVLLQATRVVARKGIEAAIDFTAALEANRESLEGKRLYNGEKFTKESKIILLLVGYAQDDATGDYLVRLQKKAAHLGVDMRYIADRISSTRKIDADGNKVYSLWDTYVFADMVTYCSYWEGWGNQFLEALKARLPILIFEYPVYKSDIADKNFTVISLGDRIRGINSDGLIRIERQQIINAASNAILYLLNSSLRAAAVEANFETAREYYSMKALREYLSIQMKAWEK